MREIYIYLIFNLIGISASGQDLNPTYTKSVDLKTYIQDVAKGNLSYIAEQFSLERADAALAAARVFTDPEIAVGYSDSQDNKMLMGKSVEAGIAYQVNLGNVRAARLGLAGSEKDLAGLVLQKYFQDLRADAALVFYNTLKFKLLADVQKDTYLRLRELASADSIRLMTGTIMEVDARQSAIEARLQKNEMIRADASWKMSLIQLTRLIGTVRPDTSYLPSGSLEIPLHDFDPGQLIDKARQNRLDLQVAIQNRIVSERMLGLLQAGRAMELGIETSLSYNTQALNDIAPSPQHYAFNMGLSIPLKFSNLNRGDLNAAKLAVKQMEVAFQDAEQLIVADVNRSFIEFQSQKQQLGEFHSGLMEEAEIILNNKIYSYKRGETGLLDVLNAQRTYNEIRQSFYQTHYDYLASLIELERAAGIWDIE
jgi:outer membrane protein, heavy metal efflux system